ncbi:SAF domain-containing protein [Neobacillus bataviensis LMG 21833]|uniref:SAF domain-containing protein n=1 Tax=Neobacillus bataviensis LMG 21833 TaxID=1117379 RepID=K6D2V2_9BACI|nr:Flp pilus assembly protein CpaB [Neobacillus bataviensis]EKN62549.1 SAF domain-containing protein [Neobacillus bataviensis LMG 21833]
MNTKKIWMISVILGMAVAAFAYITIFSKETVTTASGTESSQEQKKEDQSSKQAEKKKEEKAKKPEREFTNSIVAVSKGKRAISLKVNLEQGVSGYVAPNSMVDVIAYETTKDDATGKEFKSSVLVLENAKVLTSGKSADNKAEALQYETVTVEVTPEEGVMLGLAAKDKDGFYLMLRNTEDTESGKAGIKQTREVIKE